MTREEWSKLDLEERRIKVATLCGWRRTYVYDNTFFGTQVEKWVNTHDDQLILFSELPDYLNDLNAMHEAEKLLKYCNDPNCKNDMCGKGTWGMYTRMLDEIVNENSEKCGSWGVSYCATASQRAEAFILTMDTEND